MTLFKKTSATALMSLFATAMFVTAPASAEVNPFSSADTTTVTFAASGDKCGEGKCGEGKAKAKGKCGEGKCGEGKAKAKGKCGEGKCGEGKAKAKGKCGEGKCGEGKAKTKCGG